MLPISITQQIEAAQAAERIGNLDEALETYRAAFDQIGAHGDPEHAAMVLRWIGTMYRRKGDLTLAEESYMASEAISAANDDMMNLAGAVNCLGIIAQLRADVQRAAQLYGHARDLAITAGDNRLAAMADQNIATLANMRGDVQSAIVSYWSAFEQFRAIGDEVAIVWSLNNLGMAYTDLEDFTHASECLDDAFQIANRLQDPQLLGTIELNRAELFVKRKELQRARETCDRAFEIFVRNEIPSYLGEAYKFYGIIYREMHRPGLSKKHFEQAAALAITAEDRLLEAETQSEWALLELDAGENRAALHRLNRAHQLFEQLHADADLVDLDARLDRLEEQYLRVLQRWAESLESTDRYLAGHCQRVAEYACRLARAVGIEGRDLTWFRMGAYLHDVGKTALPPEVLNKPGQLTKAEFEQMKTHTAVGEEIIADLNFPWDICPMVRNHHERWDGTGYPDGLKGEEIPLTARILCVADVYDALTTARSYRPALPQDEALRLMVRDRGTLVDPKLFDLFVGLIAQQQTVAR